MVLCTGVIFILAVYISSTGHHLLGKSFFFWTSVLSRSSDDGVKSVSTAEVMVESQCSKSVSQDSVGGRV